MITGIYAGILGIIFIILSMRVSGERMKVKSSIGSDHPSLLEKIRGHGNFTEWVPITLILMVIFEINSGKAIYLHMAGVILILSRVLHVFGVKHNVMPHPLRAAGATLNLLLILTMSTLVVYQGLMQNA